MKKNLFPLAGAAFCCALILCPGALRAQGNPLQISTIQVTPGQPVQFTFADSGTGATNYLVEFSSSIGSDAAWSNLVSAVISPLGPGNFRVQIPNLQTAAGFLRVRGYGGTAGIVSVSIDANGALQGTVSQQLFIGSSNFLRNGFSMLLRETNVLYVMPNGNDATAVKGNPLFPWLTVSNALWTATNGRNQDWPGDFPHHAVLHTK